MCELKRLKPLALNKSNSIFENRQISHSSALVFKIKRFNKVQLTFHKGSFIFYVEVTDTSLKGQALSKYCIILGAVQLLVLTTVCLRVLFSTSQWDMTCTFLNTIKVHVGTMIQICAIEYSHFLIHEISLSSDKTKAKLSMGVLYQHISGLLDNGTTFLALHEVHTVKKEEGHGHGTQAYLVVKKKKKENYNDMFQFNAVKCRSISPLYLHSN